MKITASELNRATLARQLLLGRERLDVLDAVHRVVALQAQFAASPYVALWNRLTGFDPADLDTAFADGSVVKATLMRMTLHAVHADDYRAFHEAMQPSLRGARLSDPRFAVAGLSIPETDALVPELLKFAKQPRTNADFEAWLDKRFGVLPRPGVWWAVRTFAQLRHAPTGGAWSFGTRPAYVASGTRPSAAWRDVAEKSMPVLVRRYLQGFGPASAVDLAQFTLVARVRARNALQALAGELEQLEGPDGTQLYDIPGSPRPAGDTPAPPRLLPMWDSILLAYSDRGRVIPPEYRRLVIRSNGDVLPTLLVDGHVAGVWRPVDAGIEATAFHPLPAKVWKGLAAEAGALVAFLADREPGVYRRFARWWAELPTAEVRMLAG